MKNMFRKALSLTLAFIMLLSVMPAVISAAYRTPFDDVKPTDYFYEPVIWAYGEGITTGTTATKFAPDDTCTRGQVVTFLWRALGEPEPVTKENRFNDVKDTDYYYKPVLWAVENGITNGTSEKMFSPAATCTNAHILTFIWRALGEEGRTGDGEWYQDAENWAKKSGLLYGTYTGEYDVSGECPRANVVTYLFRYLDAGDLTVYVSADADASVADGSAEKPFATIEAARDYVRTLDKSGLSSAYKRITVRIGAGEYILSDTVKFTKEDSGTEMCPVRYVGEDGTHFYGGVTFGADAFEALGSGEVVQYFPAEVKDRLVQIDLKKFGFTKEDAEKMQHAPAKGSVEPTFLFCNGEKQTVARFPNETDNIIDGYARICEGSTIEPEWTGSDNGSPDDADYYVIYFSDEYNERVHSWHDIYDGYVEGRFRYLWCSDGSSVAYLDPAEPLMKTYFAGGYVPREGMVFFWFHIPEELDIPGEYYVDDECILYYYPTDDFRTAVFSMPTLNDHMITVDGAEYLTFENLSLESSRQDGINGSGNHITVDNCNVHGTLGNGIRLDGTGITVQNCNVSYVGKSGIFVTGGDIENLIRANNLIYNNYVSDWSIVSGIYEMAISSRSSCGTTISHNEICHSVDWGIEIAGAYNTVEYNYCHDLCLFQGDQAVIHVCTTYGGIVRYNYICNAGFNDDKIDFMGISGMDTDCTLGEVETYCNVVCNVTGNGELMCNPRNASVHDNLFISCRKGAVKFTDQWYSGKVAENPSGSFTHGDASFLNTKVYTDSFPWIRDIKMTGTMADINDPDFWIVPAKCSIKNNFVYIDKANLSDPGKMSRVYEYWPICEQYSEIIVPSNDEIVTFSSKRNGMPEITDAIERAAGTISLTVEEFNKIGRIK